MTFVRVEGRKRRNTLFLMVQLQFLESVCEFTRRPKGKLSLIRDVRATWLVLSIALYRTFLRQQGRNDVGYYCSVV